MALHALRTQEEVGQMLGITGGGVYMAERRIFRKLQRAVLKDPTLRGMCRDLGLLEDDGNSEGDSSNPPRAADLGRGRR